MISWIRSWTKQSDLSVLEKQQITTQIMSRSISELFTQMKLTYFNGQKQIYNNPLGLTPDEVMEGFGSDAMELIRLATLLKDCLNVAITGTIPDGPNDYGTSESEKKKR